MKYFGFAVIVVPVAFLVGLYAGESVNYEAAQVDLISCAEYPENFLEYLGFEGENKKEECENLNLALHRQALDECEDKLGPISSLGQREYSYLKKACVYHELETTIGITFASALIRFRNSK